MRQADKTAMASVLTTDFVFQFVKNKIYCFKLNISFQLKQLTKYLLLDSCLISSRRETKFEVLEMKK